MDHRSTWGGESLTPNSDSDEDQVHSCMSHACIDNVLTDPRVATRVPLQEDMEVLVATAWARSWAGPGRPGLGRGRIHA